MKIGKISGLTFAQLKTISITFLPVALVVLAVLIVFWQDFSILGNETLTSESLSHIILVPFMITYLLYRKKKMMKASVLLEKYRVKKMLASTTELAGLALCFSAFFLYWYGSYTFYPIEYHVASLIIFLSGLTLVLFSVKTLKAIIFPILFLVFLIPPPSEITFTIGTLLGNFSAQSAYTVLKTLSLPVDLSSSYGPPTLVVKSAERPIEFAIDIACSGIYSLMAFVMFAAFLVYIVRGSLLKKIALFPIGFLMLPFLNILRMLLIVFMASALGEEIAMTIFHVFSGWLLIFLGMLLLFIFAEKLLHLQIFRSKKEAEEDFCAKCKDTIQCNETFCSNCGRVQEKQRIKLPNRFWVKVISLLLVSYVITLSIQAPIFAFAQGLTITNSNPESNTDVFPQVQDYNLRFLYRDQNFEKISRQDASLLYAYISQNTSNPTIYVLVGVANSVTNLHSWEVCLVSHQQARGYAPLVTTLESLDVQIMQNPPITARYFVFQHPDNYTQVTLYWYQKALFKTGMTVESKYIRISLIILTKNLSNYSDFKQKLLDVGENIAAYWEPLKTQSLVSLGIPTIQVLLVSTVLFAVIIQTAQYTKELGRKATNLKIFERLASPDEKLLYQTIKDLSQTTKETTVQKITAAFEKVTCKVAEMNRLIEMLRNQEKVGVIRPDIVSVLDEPKLVWKP